MQVINEILKDNRYQKCSPPYCYAILYRLQYHSDFRWSMIKLNLSFYHSFHERFFCYSYEYFQIVALFKNLFKLNFCILQSEEYLVTFVLWLSKKFAHQTCRMRTHNSKIPEFMEDRNNNDEIEQFLK